MPCTLIPLLAEGIPASPPTLCLALQVVAGFAENQNYGLGTNSMTGDQKLLLIYGGLALFFILFLGGYALG